MQSPTYFSSAVQLRRLPDLAETRGHVGRGQHRFHRVEASVGGVAVKLGVVGRAGRCPGNQTSQPNKVPAVQRKLYDGLVFNDLAERRAFGLD